MKRDNEHMQQSEACVRANAEGISRGQTDICRLSMKANYAAMSNS